MGLFAMMRAWLITALLALLGTESALAASKGTLVIRSPQGASVTVNGLAAGKTPLKAMKLRPGKYKIEISRLGFMTYRKTVRVAEGETRLVKARHAVAGVVVLQSNVPGAEVLVKARMSEPWMYWRLVSGGSSCRSSHLVMRSSRWQWKGSRGGGLSARFAWLRRLAGLLLDALALDMPSDEPAELSLDLELDMPSEGDTAPELARP